MLTLTAVMSMPLMAAAQRRDTAARTAYTIDIEHVEVSAARPMKQIGVQRTHLDSAVLHDNIALSLADALTFNSTVFIKQYGARHALDGILPRHLALAYAGDVERHEDQLAHAGHDRLLDDTVILHRRCVAAARHLLGERHGRRSGRRHSPLDRTHTAARIRPAIRSGRRVVLHIRRVPAPHIRQRPLAGIHTRRIFILAQRLPLRQPRQEGEHLRRAAQHHRPILPRRAQPQRRLPRPAPASGGILQYGAWRPLRPDGMVCQFAARHPSAERQLRRRRLREPPARAYAAQCRDDGTTYAPTTRSRPRPGMSTRIWHTTTAAIWATASWRR